MSTFSENNAIPIRYYQTLRYRLPSNFAENFIDFIIVENARYVGTQIIVPMLIPVLQELIAQYGYATALPYFPAVANFALSTADFINKQVQARTKSSSSF